MKHNIHRFWIDQALLKIGIANSAIITCYQKLRVLTISNHIVTFKKSRSFCCHLVFLVICCLWRGVQIKAWFRKINEYIDIPQVNLTNCLQNTSHVCHICLKFWKSAVELWSHLGAYERGFVINQNVWIVILDMHRSSCLPV